LSAHSRDGDGEELSRGRKSKKRNRAGAGDKIWVAERSQLTPTMRLAATPFNTNISNESHGLAEVDNYTRTPIRAMCLAMVSMPQEEY
jgi:hypothetical protein